MRYTVALLVCWLLCIAQPAAAQWQSEDAPITMTPPTGWAVMDDALLADTNRQVRHVTGGNFIAGWTAYESEVLLFPYLLVQHVPYTTLAEPHRPTHRLDQRGMLQLIGQLVRSLNTPDSLPDDIDLLAFSETYGSEQVRLVHLEAGGTFVLTGTIPLGDGSGVIEYHTAGVLGREAAAFATVFTLDGLDALRPAIDGAAATLAFTEGAGWDALPERDPGVVGFLPPADEPLPDDALLVGEGRVGFTQAAGFFPMASDRFDPRGELLLSALPEPLRTASFEQVLTRTPASRRVSHPWAASAFVPWSAVGIDGPLAFQLTPPQWASVIARLIGLDESAIQGWLGDTQSEQARPEIAGVAQGEAQPWVLVAADTSVGRLMLKQTAALDGETMTRRLTLVMGVEGLAVFVSQTYADVVGEEVESLQSMADTMRFAGGGRLVDVPPAQDATTPGGADGPGDALPAGQSDASDADVAASPTPGTTPAAPTEPAPDDGLAALPYVLGGLGLVFIAVVVIVVITTHKKAARQREKARARRERREG